MKVVLELKSRIANVKRITVREDVVMGRSSECSLRLPSSQVSRKHCSLTFRDDTLFVTDLGSSNGTWLNEVKLPANQPLEVQHKMKLSVGPINFVVHLLKNEQPASDPDLTPSVPTPEITGLAPVTSASESSEKQDAVKPKAVNVDKEFRQATSQEELSAENPPIAAESSSADGILQIDESMLAAAQDDQDDDGNFDLPTLDDFDSDLGSDQMADGFNLIDDSSLEVVEEVEVVEDVDEILVLDNVEVVDAVEVVDQVEILDDIEVLDDIDALDDIEVLDDIEILDQVDVIEELDDIEVIDDEDAL